MRYRTTDPKVRISRPDGVKAVDVPERRLRRVLAVLVAVIRAGRGARARGEAPNPGARARRSAAPAARTSRPASSALRSQPCSDCAKVPRLSVCLGLTGTLAMAQSDWRRLSLACSEVAMTHDSARSRTVVFGAADLAASTTAEWDGKAWSRRRPPVQPSPRTQAALAYDAARAQTVMFGGNTSVSRVSETWLWSGSAWTQASPASSPSPRIRHALAYDGARKRVVLFGGSAAWSRSATRGSGTG
jgi:hypothetical protein